MSFRVVLDACVLYPFTLRDLLLRLAERELFDVSWSHRILEEAARNLVANGQMDEPRARRLVEQMSTAFPDAAVPRERVALLESAMPNDPGDRHVLAAAVAVGASAVVTINLRHFLPEDCRQVDIEPVHPDDFLCTLVELDRWAVVETIRELTSDLQRPRRTTTEVVNMLSKTCPTVAPKLQSALDQR